MSEAVIRQATTTFHLIEGEQVKRAEELTIDGKPVLIVKGGNTQQLVNKIWTEFSKKMDRAGKPFTLSRRLRGIMHTDPYGLAMRIPAPQLEAYLSEWFSFVELVHSAPPRTVNSPILSGADNQYLRLLDSPPSFTVALISQSRFATNELLALFQFID
jgi:hypothetical protein